MRQPLGRARLSTLAEQLSLATLAIGLGLAPAQASTYTLNLSGYTSTATSSSFTSGSYRYDQWYLGLVGLPQFHLFQGDVINATVTLDHECTIPASVPGTYLSIGLTLRDPYQLTTPSSTLTTLWLFDQGVPVLSPPGPAAAGSSGDVYCGTTLTPPNNAAITFNRMTLNSRLYALGDYYGAVVNPSVAYLSWQMMVPIPEPSSFGLLGTALSALALAHCKRTKVS